LKASMKPDELVSVLKEMSKKVDNQNRSEDQALRQDSTLSVSSSVPVQPSLGAIDWDIDRFEEPCYLLLLKIDQDDSPNGEPKMKENYLNNLLLQHFKNISNKHLFRGS